MTIDPNVEYSEQIMVRLTPHMHDKLKAQAKREDRTVSQVVRRAVRAYLAKEQH